MENYYVCLGILVIQIFNSVIAFPSLQIEPLYLEMKQHVEVDLSYNMGLLQNLK